MAVCDWLVHGTVREPRACGVVHRVHKPTVDWLRYIKGYTIYVVDLKIWRCGWNGIFLIAPHRAIQALVWWRSTQKALGHCPSHPSGESPSLGHLLAKNLTTLDQPSPPNRGKHPPEEGQDHHNHIGSQALTCKLRLIAHGSARRTLGHRQSWRRTRHCLYQNHHLRGLTFRTVKRPLVQFRSR
jgi:hypothetical protein